jgi:hypothetical protein
MYKICNEQCHENQESADELYEKANDELKINEYYFNVEHRE